MELKIVPIIFYDVLTAHCCHPEFFIIDLISPTRESTLPPTTHTFHPARPSCSRTASRHSNKSFPEASAGSRPGTLKATRQGGRSSHSRKASTDLSALQTETVRPIRAPPGTRGPLRSLGKRRLPSPLKSKPLAFKNQVPDIIIAKSELDGRITKNHGIRAKHVS